MTLTIPQHCDTCATNCSAEIRLTRQRRKPPSFYEKWLIDLLDQPFLVKTWWFPALPRQANFRRAIRCTSVAMLWDRQRHNTAARILSPGRFLLRAPSSARALAPYSNRYARTSRGAAFSGRSNSSRHHPKDRGQWARGLNAEFP